MKINVFSKCALIVSVCAVALSFVSCMTYKNLKTENYGDAHMYEVGSKKPDLIIYLEGSGKTSVLGERKNNKWVSVNFGYMLAKSMGDSFQIAIPEKLDIGIGENHSADTSFLKNYTVDGLTESYCKAIDGYLDNHREYKNVYIIATSEGGLLFPKIYSQLIHNERINKAIVIGSGGLSQAECFRILSASAVEMPPSYRAECQRIDEAIQEVKADPQSVEKKYFGWPYARWSSFFDYKPFDYYKEIRIPVLFYQGKLDWSSPVESVQYIQKNLPENPFEYMYIDKMGHTPDMTKAGLKKFADALGDWLRKE